MAEGNNRSSRRDGRDEARAGVDEACAKGFPIKFLKHLFCQLHSSELDTMVAGDVEGDVGEQLVEEAVDHRHDDDARTAALRHQLRHLLLHQHLQGGWTKFVFHHVSSQSSRFLNCPRSYPKLTFSKLPQILPKASLQLWEWER